MKRTVTMARFGRGSVCLALVGMLCLASCQSGQDIRPEGVFQADSTKLVLATDPPVKPSGPGGGS